MGCSLTGPWRPGGGRHSSSHFVPHALLPVGRSPCWWAEARPAVAPPSPDFIQPVRLQGQICVFSFLKASGFCGNMHNMEVKGIKNGQKFQFILVGFQLKLMSSKLFLVSVTFCPLFFPMPALWTSHSIIRCKSNSLIEAF